MSKRFTDTKKWRNEWFRTLPVKAKLTWSYLCDECDFAGVWKADWGLASFQLDFKITAQEIGEWFGDKVHFFDGDKVLIVPFYDFQYGESKETWSAKIKAKSRLETLGFITIDNKIQMHHTTPTVGAQSHDSGTNVLSVGIGTGIGKGEVKGIEKGGVGEKTKTHPLAELWNERRLKLPKALKVSKSRRKKIDEILKEHSLEELGQAIDRLAASDFCNGKNDRAWVATFDFLLQPDTPAKALEGKYDNRVSADQIFQNAANAKWAGL